MILDKLLPLCGLNSSRTLKWGSPPQLLQTEGLPAPQQGPEATTETRAPPAGSEENTLPPLPATAIDQKEIQR